MRCILLAKTWRFGPPVVPHRNSRAGDGCRKRSGIPGATRPCNDQDDHAILEHPERRGIVEDQSPRGFKVVFKASGLIMTFQIGSPMGFYHPRKAVFAMFEFDQSPGRSPAVELRRRQASIARQCRRSLTSASGSFQLISPGPPIRIRSGVPQGCCGRGTERSDLTICRSSQRFRRRVPSGDVRLSWRTLVYVNP